MHSFPKIPLQHDSPSAKNISFPQLSMSGASLLFEHVNVSVRDGCQFHVLQSDSVLGLFGDAVGLDDLFSVTVGFLDGLDVGCGVTGGRVGHWSIALHGLSKYPMQHSSADS